MPQTIFLHSSGGEFTRKLSLNVIDNIFTEFEAVRRMGLITAHATILVFVTSFVEFGFNLGLGRRRHSSCIQVVVFCLFLG